MQLKLLPNNHYGIDGVPVYEFVRKKREALGLSKYKFVTMYGLDHGEQYRFELGKNRSLAQAIAQLEALGYTVTISVEE